MDERKWNYEEQFEEEGDETTFVACECGYYGPPEFHTGPGPHRLLDDRTEV